MLASHFPFAIYYDLKGETADVIALGSPAPFLRPCFGLRLRLLLESQLFLAGGLDKDADGDGA